MNAPQGTPFHHGNAAARTSLFVMTTILDCGYELVPYSPSSPDVVPSNIRLFTKMSIVYKWPPFCQL